MQEPFCEIVEPYRPQTPLSPTPTQVKTQISPKLTGAATKILKATTHHNLKHEGVPHKKLKE